MINNIVLFDMDGVLLIPGGYHKSLKVSLNRIGKALGIPGVRLTDEQIARFESISVTNEWDSLAICSAYLLVKIWQSGRIVQLDSLEPGKRLKDIVPPDFDEFLDKFIDVGELPGHSAYALFLREYPWLKKSQRNHLSNVLHQCRDIFESLTLPVYQETVLGSKLFQETYHIEPQVNTESFLLKYDRPALFDEKRDQFREWLSKPGNAAGIMTNRPCSTPDGYLSPPEAELGSSLIELKEIPLLGSSMLTWYAETFETVPNHTFLKPHPVHALALMAMCTGSSIFPALENAQALNKGVRNKVYWSRLNHTRIIIFEDSTKGLISGLRAKELLSKLDIDINLKMIGISNQPAKRHVLKSIANIIYSEINEFDWRQVSSID